MNCYNHPSRHAVAQCVDCHKGLCYTCASKYEIPICDTCNNRRKRYELKEYLKPIVLSIIIFIIGFNIDGLGADNGMTAYFLASAYIGWKAINHFITTIWIWATLQSLLFQLFLKFAVALFLGVFIAPFYWIYCIYKIIRTLAK